MKKQSESRKGTLRRCGRIWQSSESGYPDDWETTVDGRFHVMTWKFGSIHQAKVLIDYDHLIEGKVSDSPKHGGTVDFYLEYGKTMEEAMTMCLDWIAEFQKTGVQTPTQMFEEAWKNWPTLFVNGWRLPVIDHTFFTIGGGMDWLDGALVHTSPYSHRFSEERRKKDEDLDKALAAADEVRRIRREAKLAKGEELDYFELTEEERAQAYWGQDVCKFYPASENYSNVCLVPDDVKPEWLELAYEAAKLLRDKSGLPKLPKSRFFSDVDREHDIKRQEDNRALGAKVVADLERRFPQLVMEADAKEGK